MIPLFTRCERCKCVTKNDLLQELDDIYMCPKCYAIAEMKKEEQAKQIKKEREKIWNTRLLKTKKA